MYEIWRHAETGKRFLVVVRDGRATVAAGPLAVWDDPRRVLETHGNQNHNPWELVKMRHAPGEYIREYTSDRPGRVVDAGDVPVG